MDQTHSSPILPSSLMIYLVLSVLVTLVFAQDYSIPTQWLNTTSSLSRDSRVQLAKQFYTTLGSSYDGNSGQIPSLGIGQNANMLSATAIHDSIVPDGQTSNYNVTSDRFSRAISSLVPAQGGFSNDPMMWGLTAVYAYRAYQQRPFLAYAIQIWETYTPWVISEADAAKGSHPLKNFTFPSECNGSSISGGVFWRIDPGNQGDSGIIAGGEGAYMAYDRLVKPIHFPC
ncbi:hypothetical protein QCA50_008186 [Cerrena zonata]|uniref:Cellulase n=1 Tax=Cerrena zonata TaxID=2478898 RepID=A0AAW0G5R9_9APHY